MIFDVDKIWEIKQKAIESGLQNKRDLLLGGINRQYVAELHTVNNPGDQLLSDLRAMNEDGAIIGGQVPLELWLNNAAYATALFPDKQVYFAGLAKLAAAGAIEKPYTLMGDAPPGDMPSPTTIKAPESGSQIPDIGVALAPLLVFGGAVILHATGIKGWQVLSPIALVQAIWMIFRLWNMPANEFADVKNGQPIIARRFENLPQVGILLVILSIAASGLMQLNW